MALTNGTQLRAARALLNLEKGELAELAGISPNTLRRMEESDGPFDVRTATARSVEQVLTSRGVELLDDGAPGARLRKREGVAA